MSIINAKRLRDYPRLMLFSTWLILAINLLLHQGWIGAFGQLIGGDFIMFYSTGQIYRSNPDLIYDYDTQIRTQQELVNPTILPGYNPYMNPPFMAPFYSLLTYVPLNWAIIIWTLLAILSVFVSAYLLYRLFFISQQKPTFPCGQLIVIIFSFFPFLEGLQSGQNHWLTLLLVSAIIYAIFKEQPFLAGALAGVLIYKPQFVLGFILIWLIWKNWKALLAFGLVALGWAGIFMLVNGFDLYWVYLQLSQVFMNLPYIPGFPNYLLVTFYGLLTSIFPQSAQTVLSILSQILLMIYAGGLAWLAYQYRKSDNLQRIPVFLAALIFPLLATPYALLHDMLILIPAFVLVSIYSKSRYTLYAFIIIYLGSFFLTFIAVLTKIAWVSLLVIGLFISILIWTFSRFKPSLRTGVAR
jgi:TRAP-type C4-dicarboxylate transport system permease small subunit